MGPDLVMHLKVGFPGLAQAHHEVHWLPVHCDVNLVFYIVVVVILILITLGRISV